jgi:MscS family membrane protein
MNLENIGNEYLYPFLVGVVILLIGLILGIVIKKIIVRVLNEIEFNSLIRKIGIKRDFTNWIGSLSSYLIYLITFIFLLSYYHVENIALYVFLIALILLIILTFIVGLKDIIPNLIGWLYVIKSNKIAVGKKIKIAEIEGVVEKIGYLETEIKTENNDILYIPNALLIKRKLKLFR